MYFSSSTRAAETKFRWNGVVVKSSVVSHRLCRVTEKNKTRPDCVPTFRPNKRVVMAN